MGSRLAVWRESRQKDGPKMRGTDMPVSARWKRLEGERYGTWKG